MRWFLDRVRVNGRSLISCFEQTVALTTMHCPASGVFNTGDNTKEDQATWKRWALRFWSAEIPVQCADSRETRESKCCCFASGTLKRVAGAQNSSPSRTKARFPLPGVGHLESMAVQLCGLDKVRPPVSQRSWPTWTRLVPKRTTRHSLGSNSCNLRE